MPSHRLESLDAFRGITIAGMILVNNPGSWSYVYGPLRHAEWHGWTPTDLIFPFFLFIVGVAMAFSIVPKVEAGADRRVIMRGVLKRSAIIIGLGLFMSAYPRFDIGAMRFPGVLQRIGLVFFFASLACVYLSRRQQVLLTVGLLFTYWMVMAIGGDLSPDGNLAASIDRTIFGSHIWQDTWDPEGLLSTMPAVATTLTGLFTGYLLRSNRSSVDITGALFTYGWIAIVIGLFWNHYFPINKNLWTSSYVIFTTGAALQFLGVCFWTIEVKRWKRWAWPAVVFGKNAIAVFVLSGLLAETMLVIRVPAGDGATTSLYGAIYRGLFVSVAGPLRGSLLFAMATIAFWFVMMWLLWRKNIFIKV